MRKLYRNEKDKVLGGLVGGLGEYFEVDPVMLRLVVLFLILITGIFPGVVTYFVALLIVPKPPASPAHIAG